FRWCRAAVRRLQTLRPRTGERRRGVARLRSGQDIGHGAVTGLLPRPLADDVVLPIGFDDDRLDTPAILVDLDVVDSNIHRMAEFARRAGFSLRPHVKTHKSVAMAKRQLGGGGSGLAVATTAEAMVMARSGVTDLLLAYPTIGRRKLERVAPLAKEGIITFISDSAEATHGYGELARYLDCT